MKNIAGLVRRFFAAFLALLNIIPSVTVILNPLLFIMFLPLGIYALLFQPWLILKDIPDPIHSGESLYWLTYAIRTEESMLFPSLFRWGVLDLLLVIFGLAIFLLAFLEWLLNLRRGGGLLTYRIYGVSRHPQYLGIILFTLGLSLRSLRPISLIAWILLLFSYMVLASLEERDLLSVYGEEYENYSRRVAFMIPYLRVRLPRFLSPRKPYRYLLLTALCLALIILVMLTMREMVYALRAAYPYFDENIR